MRLLPSGVPIVTAAATREAEARVFASGQSQQEIMQRAGVAVAEQVARLVADRPILILAGPGNNGGDALIAAQELQRHGRDVSVATSGMLDVTPMIYQGPLTHLFEASPRATLVDGLFGIGLSRPIEPAVADRLAELRSAAALTIAIDVPSGFGTDDGHAMGGAGADVTLALGALKPVHVIGAGAAASGHVLLLDIGVPVDSDWRTLAHPALAAPSRDAHKFSRGMVAVVGGAMPGASRLAARAAMSGGAGYVVLAGSHDGQGPDALVHRPTTADILAGDRVAALLIGPGLGRDDAAQDWLDRSLASGRPLVVDGDALTLLDRDAPRKLKGLPAILTPHSAEFDRMFGTDGGDKISRTLAAARACGCTIIHKGADTVIGHPSGRVTVSSAASPWLATAGSGDVLAGLVAARLANGDEIPAESAVWLHTRAAALAGPAFIADTLVDHIPAAIRSAL